MAAAWVLFVAFTAEPPSIENASSNSSLLKVEPNTNLHRPTQTVNAKQKSWQRSLRRPLYDPPPPPKVVVKKKVRPITVKLTGTVLEPENSQAFLKLANGSMSLKRLGDQVTDDPRDGHITAITATAITIKREEDEIQLQVEGQN